MENISKQNIRIGVAAIVVIGVIAVFVFGKPAVAPEVGTLTGDQAATSSNPTITPAKTAATKSTTSTTGSDAVSVSYEKALEVYTGKTRIQLMGDTVCQVSPTMATYKNGTSIMLDNRTAEARTVTLGTAYTVPAYGFKIVKLSSTTLPVTLLMDCGKQQNVATILLQK